MLFILADDLAEFDTVEHPQTFVDVDGFDDEAVVNAFQEGVDGFVGSDAFFNKGYRRGEAQRQESALFVDPVIPVAHLVEGGNPFRHVYDDVGFRVGWIRARVEVAYECRKAVVEIDNRRSVVDENLSVCLLCRTDKAQVGVETVLMAEVVLMGESHHIFDLNGEGVAGSLVFVDEVESVVDARLENRAEALQRVDELLFGEISRQEPFGLDSVPFAAERLQVDVCELGRVG